jgi:hypothetical protein
MDRRGVLGVAATAGAMTLAGPAVARAQDSTGLRARDIAAARRAFQAGDYTLLQRALPHLLARARADLARGPLAAARAAGVYVVASQLAVKQDLTSAAGTWADHAADAARRSGRPGLLAAAARASATPLRRTGRSQRALDLLAEAHRHLAADTADHRAVDAAGMVALTASYTAAQALDQATALEFAQLADDSAARLRRLPPPPGAAVELSGAQCALYRIGIHRDLGDPDAALSWARRLHAAALPTRERQARAATDTARALLAVGDIAGAFGQLRAVERAAPQEARRPSVRALTATVADRRPTLPGLAAFTARTAPGPR